MTNKIYEQFDKHTRQVGAWAIFKGAESVGRVVIKYPNDGAGRLYAYVQVWGAPMVRSWASGYGYDKASAAVGDASERLSAARPDLPEDFGDVKDPKCLENLSAFRTLKDSGESWGNQLRALGYTVQHVTG